MCSAALEILLELEEEDPRIMGLSSPSNSSDTGTCPAQRQAGNVFSHRAISVMQWPSEAQFVQNDLFPRIPSWVHRAMCRVYFWRLRSLCLQGVALWRHLPIFVTSGWIFFFFFLNNPKPTDLLCSDLWPVWPKGACTDPSHEQGKRGTFWRSH